MRDAFRFSLVTLATMLGLIAVSLVLIGVPRVLSDDPCLRDWDIDCTSAGGVLQAMDIVGLFAAAFATRLIPVVLVIVVAIEARNHRTETRRRRRRERSARRVDEQPGAEGERAG